MLTVVPADILDSRFDIDQLVFIERMIYRKKLEFCRGQEIKTK